MAGLSSAHYALIPMSRMPDLGRVLGCHGVVIIEHLHRSVTGSAGRAVISCVGYRVALSVHARSERCSSHVAR